MSARKPPLVPGDGSPRHGTNGYNNYGCRCEVCRGANRLYQRRANSARNVALAEDPSIVSHGLNSTYLNYACRCNDCRRAHAARRRQYRAAS